MKKKTRSRSADLRGVGSLATDAVTGITDIVESMHQTIASLGGLLDSSKGKRTQGVTGMVYRNVRTLTELVGGGFDVLLEPLRRFIGGEGIVPWPGSGALRPERFSWRSFGGQEQSPRHPHAISPSGESLG